MSGWFLEGIAIEGFRGINNEGSPLSLKFKQDSVNSVSAPNGVGKSSIFDAALYAISGRIPKLDVLPAAERGEAHYLNLFHGGGEGSIALTLAPAAGGALVTVTVTRKAGGTRTVAATGGQNGESILRELNREFVLLDGKTFQQFMDDKPLDRGRGFAGLLGLKRYSDLRQSLGAIQNTRAFNNHFSMRELTGRKLTAERNSDRALAGIKESYKALVGEDYDPVLRADAFEAKVHSALAGIEILKPHCLGKAFADIDPSECVDAAKMAEGGADRDRLSKIIREKGDWEKATRLMPSDTDAQSLVELAKAREEALQKTSGDAFRSMYVAAERVLADDGWEDKSLCPVCDRGGQNSVLEYVRSRIADFDAATSRASDIAKAWADKGWAQLSVLEGLAAKEGEPLLFAQTTDAAKTGAVSSGDTDGLKAWRSELLKRAEAEMSRLDEEKGALEAKLPSKLTAVVEKAEAARRLQGHLKDREEATAEQSAADLELKRVERVKGFLDDAYAAFAKAEADASARRLLTIEPLCRDIFQSIMHEAIVPSLKKREGSEDLSIGLAEFWTVQNVSAQAVLSESFRNAFAMSVYLAAASLYGGAARFLILDDVTSSFDSGHQFHLMNVIRDRFARPGNPNGPQVVLLSHDTVLEKLFNTNASNGGWWHQCIQGTARTAVLPQSGAVNKVRDATLDLLNVGNVMDAAPRIRQYLEFKLEEVISKVKIPVPIDIAFSDERHMAKNLLDAIQANVKLQEAAASLVLEQGQRQALNIAIATIVGNYVSHWSTGQGQAFSAGALKGVMKAIDDFADCFRFEDPPGSGNKRYYKALDRKI